MNKIWLKNYPHGVPEQINPAEFASLADMFARSCSRFADRPAYTNMGRTLTFGQLQNLSGYFASWLVHGAGLHKGDRIALMLPNVLQYPVALFGAFRAGLVVVNTNPLYTAKELRHQLQDSGATAIIILENFAHTLQDVIADTAVKTVVVTGVGDMLGLKGPIVNFVLRHVRRQVPHWEFAEYFSFDRILGAGKFLPPVDEPLNHDDLAFLQYTGGTTGVAKGAELTHGNMVANVLQSVAWLGPHTMAGHDVVITALPLYHIFSLTANCLAFLILGGHSILITNPRDFAGFVKELGKYRFSIVSGVNTLFNALLHTPGFDRLDFSHLRLTFGGGMAVQATVAERWQTVTGCVVTQGWGLTETSPVACINLFEAKSFTGSIGLPIPSTEISVRDDEGREVAIGEVGELCVRGPQVMRGYWGRPEETAKVMLPEGWLRTGDIGRMDAEGFVFIEDRKKDMIVVSGFKVFPNEVEAVVAKMPGILEVAAVSEPDERSGEKVALMVVRRDPSLTEAQIIEFARRELTGYKVPHHVYFRESLPKTNVGKILRRELREELMKGKEGEVEGGKTLVPAPIPAH